MANLFDGHAGLSARKSSWRTADFGRKEFFHLLNNFLFPLLVLKGIYHFWKYSDSFPEGLIKQMDDLGLRFQQKSVPKGNGPFALTLNGSFIGDSGKVITRFMRVTTSVRRNFATFGLSELQPPPVLIHVSRSWASWRVAQGVNSPLATSRSRTIWCTTHFRTFSSGWIG